MAASHVPVLLNESLLGLNVKSNGTYIDCTFGRGGHSQAILNHLSDQGRLFVIDQDPSAIEYAEQKYSDDERVIICHETFANLQGVTAQANLNAMVDGVFFDLGVSSPQLDEAHRGFSFNHDGPFTIEKYKFSDSEFVSTQYLKLFLTITFSSGTLVTLKPL